mgnify:CR=1 FL=1
MHGLMRGKRADASNLLYIFFHRFSGTYTICIGDQKTEVTLESNYTEL